MISLLGDEYQRLCDAVSREKARRDFSGFVRQAWPVVEPGSMYRHGWHIDLVCEYLTAIEAGQIRRLVINMPPRHMKSLLATVLFPAWCWARNPHMRFLRISYAENLARRHNVLTRDVIQSDWYQRNWGDRFQLKDDANRQAGFINDKNGSMIALGVGGAVTGEGGDIILLDDPQNPAMANSAVEREASIAFFRGTLQTRLNDPARGAVVIIMQRLHEADLTGYVIEKELGYERLCLPALAEEKGSVVFPVSGRVVEREADEPLHPERFGRPEIESLRRSMGGAQFMAQMQQRPVDPDGAVFRRAWLTRTFQKPPKMTRVIQSWDLPFSGGVNSAKCAGVVIGRAGADLYVLDMVADRMDFMESIEAVRAMSVKWPVARAKVIENKANGAALIDTLRHEISGLVGFNPRGGKEERARGVSPFFEAGNVAFPERAAWRGELVEDLVRFPKGRYKDSVDALVQGILYLTREKGTGGMPVGIGKNSYWRGG